MARSVLITGASGFVGSYLRPFLRSRGVHFRSATRDRGRVAQSSDDDRWVYLDLADPDSIASALDGCDAAFYLVHGMAAGAGYAERELAYARSFASAAAERGLERIVYLGGVVPASAGSRHLASRKATGETLRAGAVPVFELRASMIIGHGSTSWKIVRDLADRLPAMILPRWLATRSQPVAVDDVVYALAAALDLPPDKAGAYDLPGPDTLTAKEILLRVARQYGHRPLTVSVPVLSPRLSSYWLKLISGADYIVARELVEGLSSDLLAGGASFWDLLPDHRRVSFDEAARRAARRESRPISLDIRPSPSPR